MRVLVTGGAGYIGSHAARALARRGHDVVVFDNLSTGHRQLAQGFELVVGSVGDAPSLALALRGIDAVMHFAALSIVPESVSHPRKYFENNVRDGLVLLNTCLEEGVRTFIFSSTAAVYGTPAKVPITEDMPKQPVNPYGMSKLAFENLLQAYGSAYGLRSMSLRYFNAAGADESGDIGELHEPETHLIPTALECAAGRRPNLEIFGDDYPTPDGTCLRDYIHVTDLAEAHVRALEYLAAGDSSGVLNLGTGAAHSVKEVIATVEQVIGRALPKRISRRRAGDPAALIADPSCAEALLGWKARLTLRDMVASGWLFVQRQEARSALATEAAPKS